MGLEILQQCSSVPIRARGQSPGHSEMAQGRDAPTVVVVGRAVRSSSAASTNSWEQRIQDKPQAMWGVMPSGCLCSSSSHREAPRRIRRTCPSSPGAAVWVRAGGGQGWAVPLICTALADQPLPGLSTSVLLPWCATSPGGNICASRGVTASPACSYCANASKKREEQC